jgi:outer membrane protein OmpA-like peptidoglycan-associated protein
MKIFATIIFILFTIICNAQNVSYTFYFDSGLDKIANNEWEQFVNLIKGIKKDSITLYGRCDSIGAEDYNLALSERRVKAIQQRLLKYKIPAKAIKIKIGYGEGNPIEDNKTYMGRRKNRSVQVYVNEIPKPILPKIEQVQEKEKIPITKQKSKSVLPKDTAIKNIAVKKATKNLKNLKADKLKKGEKIALENLLFEGMSHYLLPESMDEMTSLLELLVKNPKLKIKIIGHVCCTGPFDTDGYDQITKTHDLSIQRAAAVYGALLESGIEAARMTYEGRGGKEKLFPTERTGEEIKANRRVEIEIVAVD